MGRTGELGQGRDDQLGSTRPAAVDGRLVDAGAAGDVLDAKADVAVPAEHLEGALENPRDDARAPAAGPHRGRSSRTNTGSGGDGSRHGGRSGALHTNATVSCVYEPGRRDRFEGILRRGGRARGRHEHGGEGRTRTARGETRRGAADRRGRGAGAGAVQVRARPGGHRRHHRSARHHHLRQRQVLRDFAVQPRRADRPRPPPDQLRLPSQGLHPRPVADDRAGAGVARRDPQPGQGRLVLLGGHDDRAAARRWRPAAAVSRHPLRHHGAQGGRGEAARAGRAGAAGRAGGDRRPRGAEPAGRPARIAADPGHAAAAGDAGAADRRAPWSTASTR